MTSPTSSSLVMAPLHEKFFLNACRFLGVYTEVCKRRVGEVSLQHTCHYPAITKTM